MARNFSLFVDSTYDLLVLVAAVRAVDPGALFAAEERDRQLISGLGGWSERTDSTLFTEERVAMW